MTQTSKEKVLEYLENRMEKISKEGGELELENKTYLILPTTISLVNEISNALNIAIKSEQEIADKRVADVFNLIFDKMTKMEIASYKNLNLMQTYEVMWKALKNDIQFDTLEELKQRFGMK